MLELKKGKYKQEEVKKLLQAYEIEYSEKINGLKDRLVELTEENKNLLASLEIYKRDEAIIAEAIKEAQRKAIEIENKAKSDYLACARSLRIFSLKWTEYFKYLSEKYPYYPAVTESTKLCKEIDCILDREPAEKVIKFAKEKLDALTLQTDGFNPKTKIQDYIAATSDNGFNLDEVLNPGDLRLEDLCKELGLLEEND